MRVFMKKNKTQYLKTRVTDTQYLQFKKICQNDGMTISKLLRLYIEDEIANALDKGTIVLDTNT